MAYPKKINELTEKHIIELATEGFNVTQIARKIGVSRSAIDIWAKDKEVKFTQRTSPGKIKQLEEFIALAISGMQITAARRKAGVSYEKATKELKKRGLENLIRDRATAALDKTLSNEEATGKMPPGSGAVIGYDQKTKKYIIKCEDGFIYYKYVGKLYQGDPRGKSGTFSNIEDLTKKLRVINYELVPESFNKKRTSIKAKHLVCGNVRENRYVNFFTQDCPSCSNNGISGQENELKDWVSSHGLITEKFKFKERVTRPKEIDIYIPELSLGIEYCGLYYHGERAGKNRKYHQEKMVESNKLGISLITIFEHEWTKRNDQVKNFLLSRLNKNKHNIFARKTEIKEINKTIANNFLDDNHIQGSVKITVAFGLFYQEDLVGVVTGNEHHRIKGIFTLNRLCFKSNTNVVGGSSKLNSRLVNWAKEHGYNRIVTWSDNRWSEGKVYSAMGYELEETLAPDYFYSHNGDVYSKQSCQKKNLLKKGATGNTESEMAKSLGYDRIWDCGKKRWVLNL